ncbi:MAG TPA: cytochrome c [Gammaproteobacteria bacterium]|nr:cytochrome c [Gammaproteobacteria bacterium]
MNLMKRHYSATLAVIAACTIGVGIAGCASNSPPDNGNAVLYTYQPELTEQGTGREIYLQRCSTCHGPDGQGTKGLEIPATGPALKGDPFILAAPDALITQVIRHGRTGAKRLYDDTFPDMPSFDATLIPDLRPLIAYLKGDMQKPGNTTTNQ